MNIPSPTKSYTNSYLRGKKALRASDTGGANVSLERWSTCGHRALLAQNAHCDVRSVLVPFVRPGACHCPGILLTQRGLWKGGKADSLRPIGVRLHPVEGGASSVDLSELPGSGSQLFPFLATSRCMASPNGQVTTSENGPNGPRDEMKRQVRRTEMETVKKKPTMKV